MATKTTKKAPVKASKRKTTIPKPSIQEKSLFGNPNSESMKEWKKRFADLRNEMHAQKDSPVQAANTHYVHVDHRDYPIGIYDAKENASTTGVIQDLSQSVLEEAKRVSNLAQGLLSNLQNKLGTLPWDNGKSDSFKNDKEDYPPIENTLRSAVYELSVAVALLSHMGELQEAKL